MALPKFLQPYLPSYDLSRLKKESDAVSREIITQILNSGDDKAIQWLFKNYSKDLIKKALRRPERGVWFKDSLSYWQKILGIKTSSFISQEALLKLD